MSNKKSLFLLLLCLLVALTAGCSAVRTAAPQDESPDVVTAPPAETPAPTVEPTAEPTQDSAAALSAFRDALSTILTNRTLPDGSELDWDESDMTQNTFAVSDVDGDGAPELVLNYTTASMAGSRLLVYGADETGALHLELDEFPSATFYPQGMVRVNWSHNQGLAGENFWPFSLYRWDAQSDTYTAAGSVDAWDKSLSATRWDDVAYPDDVDTSGSGSVYYISEGAEAQTETACDVTDYEAWLAQNLPDQTPLELNALPLTQENIDAIQ